MALAMPFPYRADQVGSLLRPQELLDARRDPATPPERLREIEDRHILRVLQRQKDLGFRIFSDGELRRRGFMTGFYESVDGLDPSVETARDWKTADGGRLERAGAPPGIVFRKIRQKKRLAREEVEFLKRHSPGDIKMTVPSANQFPAIAYKKGISESAYPTRSDFLWDVAPVIRREIAALAGEGVRYIQIDAPRYSYYVDPKWRAWVRDEMGMDPEQALDEAIRVDNTCLEGIRREGVVVGIHLCRGNNRGKWYAEGGYDPIARKIFTGLNVDAFLLEYDSERAGTFEPLRFVPRGKTVVLGLVSSKLPELEPRDRLRRRIQEASRYVPLENLALSPQCGFASTMEGNLLTEEEQWRKLELVAQTAREVWK
jgi:5-methyltetrahydropteroyltriglutamate--homocysteine methyltransferase